MLTGILEGIDHVRRATGPRHPFMSIDEPAPNPCEILMSGVWWDRREDDGLFFMSFI